MSKKNRKPQNKPTVFDNMNVMSTTEMTGGIPTLMPPIQQANIFSDVFEVDTEEISDE